MSISDPQGEPDTPQRETDSTEASEPAPAGPDDGNAPQAAELEALRRLLIAPERSALTDLRHRLDTPAVRTRELAHYLPDAIYLRSGDDERLGRALQPTVEQTLRQSVRRNPKQIVEAIFPVMGPAIRRAIVSTLMGMIQSFNKVIDHTFTLRGLKWRFEALSTGRSFAEVVLLNTLIYQVEQVYLIHRTTGLVLAHVTPPDAIAQDPDLISSMLTAIQDFVRDSFAAHDEESLNTLRMGADRSIWIEQNESISLAAVIHGTPPMNLRTQLYETLQSVQATHKGQIDAFEGDDQGFADLRPRLETCLEARFKAEERRMAPLTIVLLVLIMAALIGTGVWLWQREQRWRDFIADLNAQPGMAVTQVVKKGGIRHFHGLRDPHATPPDALLAAADLPADKVKWHWRTYHDLAPEFVLPRIRERLKPPSSVSLSLIDGQLEIAGFARHRWIETALRTITAMPAISAVNTGNLKDLDLVQARNEARRLETKMIYFAVGSDEIDAENAPTFEDIVVTSRRLTNLSGEAGIFVQILILGHTDKQGTHSQNLALARRRADMVRAHLVRQGIAPHHLQAIAVSGASMPDTEEEVDAQLLRSVTFRTVING